MEGEFGVRDYMLFDIPPSTLQVYVAGRGLVSSLVEEPLGRVFV